MNEERLAVVETELKQVKNDISDLKETTQIMLKLTYNVENMCKEMKSMNERITKIENEPIDNYKNLKKDVIKYIITSILGIIIGYFATKL